MAKFMEDKMKVVNELKKANAVKEDAEARLQALQDANRFFFTTDPAQGPMYIPEEARVDDLDDEDEDEDEKPEEKACEIDKDPHNLIIGYEKSIVKPLKLKLIED